MHARLTDEEADMRFVVRLWRKWLEQRELAHIRRDLEELSTMLRAFPRK